MTQNSRVAILAVSSPYVEAWAAALEKASLDAGWSFQRNLLHDGSANKNSVLLTSSWEDCQTFGPSHIVIIAPDPGDALKCSETGATERERTRDVSIRLAEASVAVEQAQSTFQASSQVIEIPGLGLIRRESVSVSPPAAASTGAKALEIYTNLPPREGVSAEWPLQLFYFPDLEAEEVGASFKIDLTGKARVLMFGPYIELPPGRWRCSLTFALDAYGGSSLRFEWGSLQGEVGEGNRITRSGIYEISLERTWEAMEPAEFRVYLAEAAFAGHIEVLKCEVTRLG